LLFDCHDGVAAPPPQIAASPELRVAIASRLVR
jgi:hypothetical protein